MELSCRNLLLSLLTSGPAINTLKVRTVSLADLIGYLRIFHRFWPPAIQARDLANTMLLVLTCVCVDGDMLDMVNFDQTMLGLPAILFK